MNIDPRWLFSLGIFFRKLNSILKATQVSKWAGTENLSERFLSGADVELIWGRYTDFGDT